MCTELIPHVNLDKYSGTSGQFVVFPPPVNTGQSGVLVSSTHWCLHVSYILFMNDFCIKLMKQLIARQKCLIFY